MLHPDYAPRVSKEVLTLIVVNYNGSNRIDKNKLIQNLGVFE